MQEKVAILIKQVLLLADKIAYPILAPYDLTPSQYKVIKFLYSNSPATVRQTDIEKHFLLRNPTVTGILQNLEKNGWIERVQNPDDARSKVISPSQKAVSCRAEMENLGDKIEQELTKALSEEEYSQLINLLQKTKASDTKTLP